jgi:magnesium chelatase subunit I
LVFTANPEDYTARGKIITPLKDRIGSEIRTHYPSTRDAAVRITEQEAWTSRPGGPQAHIPDFVREVVEEVAFQARADRRVDKRSGVSQRLPISTLELVVSNAEQRAILAGESPVCPRISDVYAALPSITGKIELEYEGELKGPEVIARELVRGAVATVFGARETLDTKAVIDWFDSGGVLRMGDLEPSDTLIDQAAKVPGLRQLAEQVGLPAGAPSPIVAAAIDFVLEGLCAERRIGREEERYVGNGEPPPKRQTVRREERLTDDDDARLPGGKKKYYN